MNRKRFLAKADRLQAEIEDRRIANGESTDWFEIESELYERLFGEPVPTFEYDLPSDVKAKVILENIDNQRKFSDLTEQEFLTLQYEHWFKEPTPDKFVPCGFSGDIVAALRDCLSKGKVHPLSGELRELVEQGAIL